MAKAKTFFERYQALSRAYDPALANLYEDSAEISTVRDGGETEKKFSLSGAQWKEMTRRGLPLARQRGDRSRFDEVAFARLGATTRITAHRYSYLKCTTDSSYLMEVAPDKNGELRVVKEFTRTSTSSMCGLGPGKSLQRRMDEITQQVSPTLPRSVDEDTQLERLSHDGHSLTYRYALVGFAAREIDAGKFAQTMRPAIAKQACRAGTALREIMDEGGTIRYVYSSSSGDSIATLETDAADCSP